MKANSVTLEKLLSLALTGLGLYVMLGWALVNEGMVRIIPGSVAMGLNAAGLLVTTGLCLWPSTGRGILFKLRKILPWLLVILPSFILMEHIFDANFGVDWSTLHALNTITKARATLLVNALGKRINAIPVKT